MQSPRSLSALIFAVAMLAVPPGLRAADAKEHFTKHCAACHGKNGRGDTMLGQRLDCLDYSDARVQASLKDADMFKAIKSGVQKQGHTLMTPFGGKFTDAEIKDLVLFIRQFKK